MRIFLILNNCGAEMIPLAEALKKEGHEIPYWLGVPNGPEKCFPETVFHHCGDARRGLPAPNVDTSEFEPPSAELIKQLYRTESLVMSLMDKSRHSSIISPNRNMDTIARKRLYYKMLQYWQGVIKRYQPELIIFPVMPHAAYDYIVFALAQLFGIKTIMFMDTWVSDRSLLTTDFWKGSEALKREIEINKGKQFTLSDLSPDLQEYYLSQKNALGTRIYYIERRKEKFSSWRFLFWQKLGVARDNIRNGQLLKLIINYIHKKSGSSLQKDYRRLQTEPEFSQKFVYAPLHFQPECTTSPQADMFVDQILMLEILSAALPKNWFLYVKEHPAQWWEDGNNYSTYRPKGYYETIAAIKNVKIMPIDMDTFALINKSEAVVTATGTAALEAVLRGKPAFIFGYPWFRGCPGMFYVGSVKSCREAFQKIQEGILTTEQEMINYLKCLDNASFHCFVDDPKEQALSKLSETEQVNNLVKTIISEIKKY